MRTISKETYYHALALYMLARRQQSKVDELESEMNALFGMDNGTHLSDAIYTMGNTGSEEEFALAIKRMGVKVTK